MMYIISVKGHSSNILSHSVYKIYNNIVCQSLSLDTEKLLYMGCNYQEYVCEGKKQIQ